MHIYEMQISIAEFTRVAVISAQWQKAGGCCQSPKMTVIPN